MMLATNLERAGGKHSERAKLRLRMETLRRWEAERASDAGALSPAWIPNGWMMGGILAPAVMASVETVRCDGLMGAHSEGALRGVRRSWRSLATHGHTWKTRAVGRLGSCRWS